MVITGDNWQLQPVGGHPLFKVSTANLEPISMKGQTAYRALNKTFRFTQVMRQAGEAPEMVQFRDALEELRNDNLSIKNREFLALGLKSISPRPKFPLLNKLCVSTAPTLRRISSTSRQRIAEQE